MTKKVSMGPTQGLGCRCVPGSQRSNHGVMLVDNRLIIVFVHISGHESSTERRQRKTQAGLQQVFVPVFDVAIATCSGNHRMKGLVGFTHGHGLMGFRSNAERPVQLVQFSDLVIASTRGGQAQDQSLANIHRFEELWYFSEIDLADLRAAVGQQGNQAFPSQADESFAYWRARHPKLPLQSSFVNRRARRQSQMQDVFPQAIENALCASSLRTTFGTQRGRSWVGYARVFLYS